MIKKTVLCGFLALNLINPLISYADILADNSAQQNDVSDAIITSKIKLLYAKSSALESFKIHVITNRNEVTLSGVVDTDQQYEEAIYLAESVDNVSNVSVVDLHVKSSKAPLTDIYITAKVSGELLKERVFGDKEVAYWPVHVETKDGVVHLSGKVDTKMQRTNIIHLVEKIQGVKGVKSSIKVS